MLSSQERTTLEASICKSCGESILWGITKAGKRCPLDAAPQKLMIVGRSGRLVMVNAFTNHFITFPTAAEHRKKK
jgi:hypothetical protein